MKPAAPDSTAPTRKPIATSMPRVSQQREDHDATMAIVMYWRLR